MRLREDSPVPPGDGRTGFLRWLLHPETLRAAARRVRMRLRGVDLRPVSVRSIGISHDHGHQYSDSGGPELARVLEDFSISARDGILDVGCGKGGALLTIARFPFGVTAGLDLSPELLAIAGRNLRRCGIHHVELVCADAELFADLDAYSYVYLYNPFPCTVMAAFMGNVRASLERHPRTMTVIYRNPVCDGQVRAALEFDDIRDYRHAAHPIRVYICR